MTDDAELLRRYASDRSEEAFATLVRRHIDFVFSAALRQTGGDNTLAQDVTQVVFIELARKAAALGRHPALVGWLHTATRFAVGRVRRAEARRLARERAAHTPEGSLADAAPELDWARLQPVFDEVLGELKERERTAILLRFFEHRTLAEVGARLSVSESAARSCVDRALEKMRTAFARRGVTSTAAGVSLALVHQVGAAAPAGLAHAVTGAALASAGAGASAGLLAFFAMTKLQAVALAGLFVAGAITFAWERQQTQAVAADVAALRTEHAALMALQQENRRLAAASMRPVTPTTAPAPRGNVAASAALDPETEALLAAGMKPMSQWRNQGRATPAAALETLFWAALNGEFDALAPMITFTEPGKVKLDAWFQRLSPELRARLRTPERAIAPAFAAEYPWFQRLHLHQQTARQQPAFKVVGIGEPDRGGTATLKVVFSYNSDPDRPSEIHLRQEPDGWQCARLSESMVERFTARIDPTTGELRSAPEPPVFAP